MKRVTKLQNQMIQRAKQIGAILPSYDLIVNKDLKGLLLKKIKKHFHTLWREKVNGKTTAMSSISHYELQLNYDYKQWSRLQFDIKGNIITIDVKK